MTKEQMKRLAEEYGFDFKEKNHKGEYTLHSRTLDGHVISSPTLPGLKRMLEKYGK
jgi:hypothetical protein